MWLFLLKNRAFVAGTASAPARPAVWAWSLACEYHAQVCVGTAGVFVVSDPSVPGVPDAHNTAAFCDAINQAVGSPNSPTNFGLYCFGGCYTTTIGSGATASPVTQTIKVSIKPCQIKMTREVLTMQFHLLFFAEPLRHHRCTSDIVRHARCSHRLQCD